MAVKAYFNAQGCRNKGGFKLMNHMNRKKGGADVPVRIRDTVVPIPRPWSAIKPIVAITEP